MARVRRARPAGCSASATSLSSYTRRGAPSKNGKTVQKAVCYSVILRPLPSLEAIPLGVQATGACERFSVCCDRHPSPSVLKATAKTPRAPRTPGFLGWIVRSIAPGEFHSTTSRDKRARSAKSAGGAPCDDGESKMEHRDVRVSALLPAH